MKKWGDKEIIGDIIYIHVDKTRKISLFFFLKYIKSHIHGSESSGHRVLHAIFCREKYNVVLNDILHALSIFLKLKKINNIL